MIQLDGLHVKVCLARRISEERVGLPGPAGPAGHSLPLLEQGHGSPVSRKTSQKWSMLQRG